MMGDSGGMNSRMIARTGLRVAEEDDEQLKFQICFDSVSAAIFTRCFLGGPGSWNCPG